MLNARIVLILTGLAFAIWETVDIFLIEVPAMAALFAVLFLACTIWFWRRDSLCAAITFLPLNAGEAGSASFWKHVMTETKVAAIVLGAAGIVSVVALARTRLTPNRSRAGSLSSL